MKKSVRAFGIGLFLAGAIWSLNSQFSTFTENPSSKEIEKLEQQLKQANEKIKTLQQGTSAKEKTPAKEQPKEEPAAEPNEKNNETAKTGTIYVYDGVSLYDIGKQAEDAGIVKNGRELELYLYKPEYSRTIQKGQFELSSNMTLQEMANILTGKKQENE